eukprot:6454832-Pyramimonas_sp.AAC.1
MTGRSSEGLGRPGSSVPLRTPGDDFCRRVAAQVRANFSARGPTPSSIFLRPGPCFRRGPRRLSGLIERQNLMTATAKATLYLLQLLSGYVGLGAGCEMQAA